MAAADSVIFKMEIQMEMLLHLCYNVRRSVILHKKCAVPTLALFKCWDELVVHAIFIMCTIDCTSDRTRKRNYSEQNVNFRKSLRIVLICMPKFRKIPRSLHILKTTSFERMQYRARETPLDKTEVLTPVTNIDNMNNLVIYF